jgi:esterase/lipase superfamily enzyme
MSSTNTDSLPRQYTQWFSPNLQRNMELLVFGQQGQPVLFFPTRMARFYDYENWGVIEAFEEKIAEGKVQVFCIDSVDKESFYCKDISPSERINRHLLFEKYLLEELIPFITQQNNNTDLISAGCSLGAYHAVNFAFRHPHLFKKVIGISGRYDLTLQLPFFDDLFETYWNEDIYFNMPSQYIPNLSDDDKIRSLQNLEITLIVGKEDAFLEINQQLSDSLHKKNIANILHLMEGEAHKAAYWGELMKICL